MTDPTREQRLEEALRDLLALIDEKVLVRNTSKDHVVGAVNTAVRAMHTIDMARKALAS